ncbi:MAG: IclR family transcriptional regulator C-terminal domain-containing protein [Solirubrobacteraceae bacterium]
MAIPLLFAQPSRVCAAAEMVDLVHLRPSHIFTRLGQPHLSMSNVLATRSAESDSSLTASLRRTEPVRAVLEELFEETGYTVCMGALHYRGVTYLHRLYGQRRAQLFINQEIRFGSRAPLYCTALGKALLASLSESWRRRLLAQVDFIPRGPRSYVMRIELLDELATLDYREPIVSDEEYIGGARSIAVCVRRPHDEHPIAIDVTVPADDFTVQELIEQIGPSVQYAANRIARLKVSRATHGLAAAKLASA